MENRFHYTDQCRIFNEGGEGIIKIRPFGIGDILLTKEPNVITWYDCQGSVGKYVCQINDLSQSDKASLNDKLTFLLNSGDDIDLNELLTDSEKFLSIFPKQDLIVTSYDPNEYASADKSLYLKFQEWDIIFPKVVDKNKENQILDQFLQYFTDQVNSYGRVAGTLVGFSSSGFYDGCSSYFIATQPETIINTQRVEYYEQLIRSGKRPYCLVLNNEAHEIENYYLIDGHHKLIAYKNLKENPRIIEVSLTANEGLFDALDSTCTLIFNALYDWQCKHIFDNSFCSVQCVQRIKQSPGNPFNKFIKQDYVEEVWANGNIKARGSYKDNIPEGIVDSFFENGNPKSIAYYENGKCLRYLKSWFHTGELHGEYIKHPDYENGSQITYHKTGEISSKTHFENGINTDGKSSISYYPNGKVQYEATYKNGEVINRKYIDRNGSLTEEYNR
ncbi:MAG: hypothetical protein HRU12_09860 [Phaeodactylibacter sp.]|nr:hypothetical protein [Phaeodactylibacter sp.]